LQVYASGGSSWIIDSGCTNHMTGEKKMFTSYVKNKDSQDTIIFGDGNQGKQVGSTHHNKNVMTTSRPLELLHMDLFGPVAYLSIGGSKYGLVIVDDFSRFTWVFFLQDKSETQGTLKRFLRRAQNEFELKVKKIRSDNGSEFKNLQVEEYLEEEGIKHEFSAPYTPQQNGVVERKNRTLIDMARTMLGEFKTPERFWSEAMNTTCHAINRLCLHRLLKKTSYELLTGNKPNVSYFHVFGSKCYILVKKGRKSKFAPKAVEGFLLGYDSNTKAYRVFNKSSGLVQVSSNVVFDETNGSPREQVDLDDVDEDDVPTAVIRTMAIGMCDHRNNKNKINLLPQPWCIPQIKRRRVIKGEHKKNKLWRKKHHWPLQLKSERRFKGIIPSTRF
jgi:transposase InsO family protein